jgi:hypothetical protein
MKGRRLPVEIERAAASLPPGDPVLPLLELAVDDPHPVVCAGVIRRILAEIERERGTRPAETDRPDTQRNPEKEHGRRTD